MNRRLALLAFATVALCAAMTGCAAAAPAPASTVSPVIESQEPAEPTIPAESPTDPDDPAAWTFSAAGIGPLVIGAEFDHATTEIGPYIRVSPECADAHVLRFDGDGLGRLQVVLEQGGARIDSVMVMSGPTGDAVLATESEIAVGSEVTTLLATYPDARQTREHPSGGTYAVADGLTWLAFAVDEGIVRSIAASASDSPFREYCA